MNKGISAIIATIILLMITIALAGTAYIYMSGMIRGKTSKTISVLDASCTGGTITLIVSNDGTEDIDNTGATKDLRIIVGGNDKTSDFEDTTGSNTYTIPPHSTIVLSGGGYSGTNQVFVISPSNSISRPVYC